MESGAKAFYLCDGQNDNCNKMGCYKIIGDCDTACRYTTDVRHAKNFYKDTQSQREYFLEKKNGFDGRER